MPILTLCNACPHLLLSYIEIKRKSRKESKKYPIYRCGNPDLWGQPNNLLDMDLDEKGCVIMPIPVWCPVESVLMDLDTEVQHILTRIIGYLRIGESVTLGGVTFTRFDEFHMQHSQEVRLWDFNSIERDLVPWYRDRQLDVIREANKMRTRI